MAEPTIIGMSASTYVRTARMVCLEKGIAHEHVEAMPHAPEAEAAHPWGRVPALRHGDLTLFETTAICRYLDEGFPGQRLQPGTLADRALMEQWISVVGAYVYPDVIRQIVLPRAGFAPLDEERIAAAVPAARHTLGVVDAALARGGWLAGANLSLADLFLAPIVFYVAMMPEGKAMLPALGNLMRWYEMVAKRPSFALTEPKLG